MIYFYC